jgi:hypothetical protein
MSQRELRPAAVPAPQSDLKIDDREIHFSDAASAGVNNFKVRIMRTAGKRPHSR